MHILIIIAILYFVMAAIFPNATKWVLVMTGVILYTLLRAVFGLSGEE